MPIIIETQHLTHIYSEGAPNAKKALDDITLNVAEGEFLGVVGANGSGKSTLIQHLNGLLRPTKGRVIVCGKDAADKEVRNELWKEVGMVFQFPEQQLFEATVFEDVAFGPKNLGLDREEIAVRVHGALQSVGLNPDEVGGLPPLCLSGGMRRLVAIAGVLAMRPKVLVLDEPTAGLDPRGRRSVVQMIRRAQREQGATVVMVSHSLKELISHADQLAVMEQGRLVAFGPTGDLIRQQALRGLDGIALPDSLQLLYAMAERGQMVDPGAGSINEIMTNLLSGEQWKAQGGQ